MSPPLGHITVIDFTQLRAGPWCTNILGELGAEVIKIEHPEHGDSTRNHPPEQNGLGSTFISLNKNKKSVAVDVKTNEGREVIEGLVADADVFVENFSTGAMGRLGLNYNRLCSEVNSELIYSSIKGYGESGPYKDRKGIDLVMQAEGGFMSVTGFPEDEYAKVGQAIGDVGTGLFNLIGILTALNHRERTGEGQKVESDIFGSIVAFMEEYVTRYGITGENPTPYGTRHQTIIPYELFETKDDKIVFGVLDERSWDTFVTEIIDEEEMLEYDSHSSREQNYDQIMETIRPKLREKTTEEWQEIFDEYGIPNGPLNQVSDIVEDPHVQDRENVVEYTDDNVGTALYHSHPINLSESDLEIRSGPPEHGEHTEEVLRERLGMEQERIEILRDRDVIM